MTPVSKDLLLAQLHSSEGYWGQVSEKLKTGRTLKFYAKGNLGGNQKAVAAG